MGGIYLPASLALIEAYTCTGAETVKTFSNIPQGFNTLLLVGRIRSQRAANNLSWAYLSFNADTTAANYLNQALISGDATTTSAGVAGTDAGFVTHMPAATAPAGACSSVLFRMDGYTDGFHKGIDWSYQNRIATGSANVADYHRKGQWLNVAAITSLTMTEGNTANFVAGSTLRLYGQI